MHSKQEGPDLHLFHAVVSNSDPGTFNVQVEPLGSNKFGILQGIPLSNCFASLLGFKETVLPQVGSTVLCFPKEPHACYIIGVIPQADEGKPIFPSRHAFGPGDTSQDTQNIQGYDTLSKLRTLNNRRPTDVVEGEYALSNEFGVLMGLFQQMAVLKASELAQIQVHVLDDLVRIISHNFQSYNALGEFRITHDGKRLDLELGATHLPNETFGTPNSSEDKKADLFPSVPVDATVDDSKNYFNIDASKEKIQGVERLKFYLGSLGDFINLIISRPSEDNVYTYDGKKPANFDIGLANVHVGTDGGIHVRSLKEVFVEKTNWIRVPQRIRTPEDPEGDKAEDLVFDDKKKFTFDKHFQFNDVPSLYYLQLRDYLVYVQEGLTYANIKKHEKDFVISNKFEDEKIIAASIDRVDPNTEVEYARTSSGVYLMPNGGVMLKDAWGSAIVMEGGNIHFQPANDLVMQPMRNLIAKVGRFVSIASQEDIDLSSTEGGFRLKTEKAQYLYSSKSGVILHSDGQTGSEGTPDPNTTALEDIGGVVLKSKQGVYSFAGDTILSASERNIILEAKSSLLAEGGDLAYLSTKNQGGSTGVFSGKGNCFVLAKLSLEMASEQTALFSGKASTLVGLEHQTFGLAVKSPNEKYPVEGLMKVSDLTPLFDYNDTTHTDTFQQQFSTIFKTQTPIDNVKFNFLSSTKYNLSDDEDFIPQTIVQQEDEVFKNYNLTVWKEKDINGSFPYPGKEKFENFFITNSSLKNLTKTAGDIYPDIKALTDMDTKPQLIKGTLQAYKAST